MIGALLRRGVAGTALLLVTAMGPAAADLSRPSMIRYLAQSVCLDKAGRPTPIIPIEPACSRRRPQTGADPAFYRKHDLPGVDAPKELALSGYQASDSVLEQQGGHAFIVQTLDFGDGERKFGRFDAGRGDGGQAIVFADRWASLFMTEDISHAKPQWFVGSACTTDPHKAPLSWLLFPADVTPHWVETETHLKLIFDPDACPDSFPAVAHTRYRTASIDLPFRIVDSTGTSRNLTRKTDVVISEHFGGGESVETANHLERFFFARDLGWVRWERWENERTSTQPRIEERAEFMARSGRCPTVEYSSAPGPTWRRVDCRNWTTLVRESGTWSVNMFGWDAIGQLRQWLRNRGG